MEDRIIKVSHYGNHWHEVNCPATTEILPPLPDDYYEIKLSELPKAKNKYGQHFIVCLMCHEVNGKPIKDIDKRYRTHLKQFMGNKGITGSE